MNNETVGKVISASKQWWLKINTKPVRACGTDGAIYPYIIKIAYTVEGREYTKRKWINAGKPVPAIGTPVKVLYDESKPSKAKIPK